MLKKRVFLVFWLLVSIFFIWLLLVFRVPPLYSFSLRTRDLFYKLNRSSLSGNVTLILIDEKSVNRFGRWPWKRRILASGLDKLAKAKVVALDMVFSERTDKRDDKLLSESLDYLGNVICGFFLRPRATQNPSDELMDILSDSALLRVPNRLPVDKLPYGEVNILPVSESCALSGILNIKGDVDHILRHYPLMFVFKGNAYPSLGLQILRFYYNQDAVVKGNFLFLHGRKLPVNDEGVLLNFYRKQEYYSHSFSFVDLVDNKIPERFLKNKIVIVGVSEAGVSDMKPTPIGYIPGPFLHATFLSNFINNDFVFENRYYDLMLMIVSGVIMILIFCEIENIYLRVGSYLFLALLSAIICVVMYLYHIYFPNVFYQLLFILLFSILLEVYFISVKSRESKFVESLFGAYVSPSLLKIMMEHPENLKLGGEKREISVLFSDIRGFTSISERLEPEKLVEMLNLILTPLTDVILKNCGTLDKYIGDAIMAIWNAPLSVKKHAEKAIVSGWKMIKTLERLNPVLEDKGFPSVKIGIGINTGDAVVGNMGSNQRFDYTAIGDTVNLASRIEGLNKVYGTQILASENNVRRVDFSSLPFFPVEIDSVTVKGKKEPVSIFTFLEKSSGNYKVRDIYEKALSYYRDGQFDKALNLFGKIADFSPAKTMMERCKILMEHSPADWNGVFHMKTK